MHPATQVATVARRVTAEPIVHMRLRSSTATLSRQSCYLKFAISSGSSGSASGIPMIREKK